MYKEVAKTEKRLYMEEEELGPFYSHYLEMLMFVRWLFGPPS